MRKANKINKVYYEGGGYYDSNNKNATSLLMQYIVPIYMVMIMNGINGHDNLSIVFNMHDRLLWKNDV